MDHDSLTAQFCAITGRGPRDAEGYLESSDWDLEAAIATYYAAADGEEPEDAMDTAASHSPPEPAAATPAHPGGGRTLDGKPVPASASSSSAPAAAPRQQPQRGLRTLKDIQNQAAPAQGDDGDHESDEDYNDDEQQDFFTGGEKSGLAVQNPNASNPRDQINSILKRARQNVPRPGGDEETPTSRFRGTGMTLGGDDAPSRAIPDPNAQAPAQAPRVRRELHLWQDGFSVDDGPLYRYDDPANARTLELINSGHAPLEILNVERGQEVDVEVRPHKDEEYVRPKSKYKPFSGSGQRLGSPTPGVTATPASPARAVAPAAATSGGSSTAAPPKVDVDDSSPTVTLQIRLGDGTRLQSRFNTTHTIGDVYGFVNAASPTSTQRAYALMTTFPSTELADKKKQLGELAEFKRGGVVVQKWK